jgi:hypothetical protein
MENKYGCEFSIDTRLPGMNEIIDAATRFRRRGSKRIPLYADMKSHSTNIVMWSIKAEGITGPIPSPYGVTIIWQESTRRRDIDNIQAATKFVLDGLVKAGVVAGDGPDHCVTITHVVRYAGRDRVTVIVKGVAG